MKSNEKLNLLTKSIRMTNQAIIFKTEVNKLTKAIEMLQQIRLRYNIRVEDLVREADKIQREVIPVTIIPTKKPRKPQVTKFNEEKIDGQTLEKIFGKEEAKKLVILAEKTGLLEE